VKLHRVFGPYGLERRQEFIGARAAFLWVRARRCEFVRRPAETEAGAQPSVGKNV